MRTIREGLQKLPKSFEDNPQAELWSLCITFTKAVNEYAGGKSENADSNVKSFLQESDPHYLGFKEAILRTRPKFQVVPRKEIGSPSSNGDCHEEEGTAFISFG
jgi:hypothetical protein